MPSPRLTLGRLMVLVGLVALNVAIANGWAEADFLGVAAVIGSLPALDALIVAAIVMAVRLRSRGESGTFLVGFLAAGVLASLLFIEFTQLDPLGFMVYLERALGPLKLMADGLGYDRDQLHWQVLGLVALLTVVSLPQLAAGLIGGLLTWGLRLQLVVRPRETDRTFSSSDAHVGKWL